MKNISSRHRLMSDKFTWKPGDVVLPQCSLCRHRSDLNPSSCAAFPARIPGEILTNEYDHRRPWTDATTGEAEDMGIPLEGSITFEAREGIHPDVLAALYRTLNKRSPKSP